MMKEEFAKELQSLMSNENVKFSEGTFAANVDEIWDNYITQYYDVDSKNGADLAYEWFYSTYLDDEEGLFTSISDEKRKFASELKKQMQKNKVTFSEGSFEDNVDEIWDNYIMVYYDEEVDSQGGAKVASDWFENTIFNDEERIFKRLEESTTKEKNMDRRIKEGSSNNIETGLEDYMDSEDISNMIQETFDGFLQTMKRIRSKYMLSISDDDLYDVIDEITGIALNPSQYQ